MTSIPFISTVVIVTALFAGVALTVAPRALTAGDVAPLRIFADGCPACHSIITPSKPVALDVKNSEVGSRERVPGKLIRDSGDDSEREERD